MPLESTLDAINKSGSLQNPWYNVFRCTAQYRKNCFKLQCILFGVKSKQSTCNSFSVLIQFLAILLHGEPKSGIIMCVGVCMCAVLQKALSSSITFWLSEITKSAPYSDSRVSDWVRTIVFYHPVLLIISSIIYASAEIKCLELIWNLHIRCVSGKSN